MTSVAAKSLRVTHVTTVPVSLMFLRGQAAFMRRRGIALDAISSPGPELEDFSRSEEVPVHAVWMERRITPLRDLGVVAHLWWRFVRTRPDVVHAHTPKGGLLGMIASRLAGVPVRIYHMRGSPLIGATGVRRLMFLATEWTSCHAATEVLCVSQSLRREAIERRLCGPEHARVLLGGSGQGVDAEKRFNPSKLAPGTRATTRHGLGIADDAVVFGFFGRVVREKGIDELVHAWKQVRDRVPSARLLVVGPFEPHDPIDADAAAVLAEDPRVSCVGFRSDLPALYAATDVVVLPTYREGFPNVPLEGAAMEKPVIATRVIGCIDAVEDGVTGTLVAARDGDALADAMTRYAEDEALRVAHGQAGRRRVLRDFRREAIWDAIAERYESSTRSGRRSATPASFHGELR